MMNSVKINNIFSYIKSYDNNMFSSIEEDELIELLNFINNYDLILRNTLGLEKEDTFGIELEFEEVFKVSSIREKLNEVFHNSEWSKLRFDETLKYYGYEINSPVLRDSDGSWINLEKVCSVVKNEGVITNRCGGHVHVGAHVLGDNVNSWINFVMLWSVYENIIYRFCYGGYLTARANILEYAMPVNQFFWEEYLKYERKKNKDIKRFKKNISDCRCQAVNFFKVSDFGNEIFGNTIEFRCPNGTVDPVIWQNYINLFVKLLKYCKSSNFNKDTILKRKHINKDVMDLSSYKNIYLEQAIEFCDMIFDNNLDKVYFLRQYLKSFEVGNGCLAPAKKFTKSIRS